ncbi:Transcriptional regulator PadR-like family protein [Paenibacillus sp. UNC496MF]|nr:Transcriptional regulator PadR-like family protein [Paenibacillus sp. UNC496MF]
MINVRQRTSIYQTIERLLRDGLIAVRGTSRETGRPDRTVYEATEEGKALLLEWLRDMLSALPQEFPEFPAALPFLGLLRIQEVEQLLEKRTIALKEELARITAKAAIPRLFMLEMEYKRTVIEAELKWVSCLIGDIRSGDLVWDEEWLREIAQRFASPNNEPVIAGRR